MAKKGEERVEIISDSSYHTQRKEEKVEIIHSFSAYETRKPFMSEEKHDD